MRAARRRAAILAALIACFACTSTQVLRTAPPTGLRVRVDFIRPRDLVVAVSGATDSVRFDSISVVTGRVARTEGDTLWLEDVYPLRDGNPLWPGDDAQLRVTGVGREATVSDVHVSAGKTAALIVVGAIGLAVLGVTLLYYAIASAG